MFTYGAPFADGKATCCCTCTGPRALGQVYSGVYTLKRYVPRITALHPPPASAGARQAHPVEFEPAFANQFDQAA